MLSSAFLNLYGILNAFGSELMALFVPDAKVLFTFYFCHFIFVHCKNFNHIEVFFGKNLIKVEILY